VFSLIFWKWWWLVFLQSAHGIERSQCRRVLFFQTAELKRVASSGGVDES
jgi:hypothetical protein